MKAHLFLVVLLIPFNVLGQNLSRCGLDNNPILTKTESDYLNAYLMEQRNGFDFGNKKVIFVTGSSGNRIGTKKEYFDDIKEWEKIDSKVATGIVVLTEEEKSRSGGYDVMVTYWVKRITERRKKEIIDALHLGR